MLSFSDNFQVQDDLAGNLVVLLTQLYISLALAVFVITIECVKNVFGT